MIGLILGTGPRTVRTTGGSPRPSIVGNPSVVGIDRRNPSIADNRRSCARHPAPLIPPARA